MKFYAKKISNYFSFNLNNFSFKFMTSNFLKIIAVIAMFIDHFAIIGVNNSTDVYHLMRKIGRIAFVIYAFLACVAMYNTRNPVNYLLRTLIMAIIFQIFVIISRRFQNAIDPFYLNIFFVIFFGTLTIYSLQKNLFIGMGVFVLVVLTYFVYINFDLLFKTKQLLMFKIDYSLYGYFVITSMGICFYFWKKMSTILFKTVLITTFITINILFYIFAFSNIYLANVWNISNTQIYSLSAIPFFLFYNHKDHYKNKYIKWSFASAYPLSFLIPALIFWIF